MTIAGEYFGGNRISEYGIQNGYVDYSTLAKAVNHVLCNELPDFLYAAGADLELVSGDDTDAEVFQWYVTDENGAELLKEAGELVYYSDELNLYIWGVTHFGTVWDYVLTGIPCNTGKTEQ